MDFGYETSRFLEFSRRLERAEAFCAEIWNEPRFGRRIPALFGCRPIHIRRYAARLSARVPLRRASRGAPHISRSFYLRRRRASTSRDPFEPAAFPRRCTRPLCDASVCACYTNEPTTPQLAYSCRTVSLRTSPRHRTPSSLWILSSIGGCVEKSCSIRPLVPPTFEAFGPNGSPMNRCAVARLALLIGAA